MAKFFCGIYDFFRKHLSLLWIILSLSVVVFVFFASRVNFEEDIAKFLPKSEHSDDISYVINNAGISDKIILKIFETDTSGEPDVDLLNNVTERFVEIVDSIVGDEYISDVFYKVDQSDQIEVMSFITDNMVYFLDSADYQRLDTIINRETIEKVISADREMLLSPAGTIMKRNIISDPLHISASVFSKLSQFKISDEYSNVGDYIFTKNGREEIILISTVYPSSETSRNKRMIEGMEKSISQVVREFNNEVKITYFGAAAVAVTNADRIKTDSIVSVVLAVLLIVALMFYFFRRFDVLLYLFVPVLFGGLFALALMSVAKGTISAIAIGAASIIIGVAINYSLHYVVHSKYVSGPERVLKDISFPLTIGSITTIAAFLSLLFISSGAMRDFGLFAALSLIGTTLFVLVFLPHIVRKNVYGRDYSTIFEKSHNISLHTNRVLLLIVAILTVFFAFFSPKTSFEGNMNAINYMTQEQRESFEQISQVSNLSKSLLYNVSEGKTLDEALINYEKTREVVDNIIDTVPSVSMVGIGGFLPSSEMQKKKIDLWNNFWKDKRESVLDDINEAGIANGFKQGAFSSFADILLADYDVVPSGYFKLLIDNFMGNYLIDKDDRKMVVSLLYAEPDDAQTIVEVTPGLTFDSGTMMRLMISSLSEDFNMIVYVCGIIVFVFLMISFGRLELGVLSFLPMFLSWTWILGLMGIFGIKFNIVNIILASFIFGLGDDYTIFMMEGLINEYAYGKKLVNTFKSAVALSALTMLIGIGTLVFAKHPAMHSLGEVTIIGMLSVIVMTFIIPPVLFSWLTKKKGKLRKIPITFLNLANTIVCFIVFLILSVIDTIVGFFLVVVGGKTERHRLAFHKFLCSSMRLAYKMFPFIKKNFINEFDETFEKPGVVICNHQSHLDLLLMIMLNPKLIILTNKWVWHSPFYGWIIRMADYYPIYNGIEESFDKIADRYNHGYSIVIFPEGTRSESCNILKFHQGAFYLADKLHADIIPVIIHGVGHVFPKSEFLLRKGCFTTKILQRIPYGSTEYGTKDFYKAKKIRHLYEAEYEKLAKSIETPGYYSDLVMHNYIYKGIGVEREVRKLMRDNNNFENQIAALPEEGEVTITDCGYGAYPLLAALVKKRLKITATDADREKIELARNCASVPSNLTYRCE